MRVAKGKVVGNTIVLDGEVEPTPLVEGSHVTVYVDDEGGEGWDVDAATWKKIDEARAEIRRGDYLTDAQLDAQLDALE